MLIDSGLPLVGYRFVVVIFTSFLPNPVDVQFQEVSGLNMKRTINEEKGLMTLKEGSSTQTLILKRGVFTSVSPLMVFNILESVFWDNVMVRKDILISVLDDKNIPVNAWMVTNAYLESWQWDNLSAKSNEPLIETMSFIYTDIKYIPLKFTKTG